MSTTILSPQGFGLDPIDLSPSELRLFWTLARHPHRVFPKDELQAQTSIRTTRQLDSAALRLRSKIGKASGRRAVVNVWGVGYRLLDSQRRPDVCPDCSRSCTAHTGTYCHSCGAELVS